MIWPWVGFEGKADGNYFTMGWLWRSEKGRIRVDAILVHSGCHHQTPHTGQLVNNGHFFLHRRLEVQGRGASAVR